MTLSITTQDIASTTSTGQNGVTIVTGSPTTGSVAAAVTSGSGSLGVNIGGTFTGTLAFEQSVDGINFVASDALLEGTDTIVQSTTAPGVYTLNAAANAITRVRATAAMTGSAVIGFLGNTTLDMQHVVVVNALADVVKQVVPPVTAGAYTANFVVGGIQTLTNAVRNGGASGLLKSISVIDASAQGAQLSVFFFKALPTGGTYADHGALVLAAADLPNFLGKVDLLAASYDPLGTAVKGVTLANIDLALQGDASGSIYAIATTTGTPTFASTSALTFNYGIQQA